MLSSLQLWLPVLSCVLALLTDGFCAGVRAPACRVEVCGCLCSHLFSCLSHSLFVSSLCSLRLLFVCFALLSFHVSNRCILRCGGGNAAQVVSCLFAARYKVTAISLYADEAERWDKAVKEAPNGQMCCNFQGTNKSATPRRRNQTHISNIE